MFGKFGLNQKLIKSKQMIKSLLFFLRDLHGDPGVNKEICAISERFLDKLGDMTLIFDRGML